MVEIIGILLLKFIFTVFSVANLSFGHSVAIFSLCGATACLLKSNLRPSSKNNILRLFLFLWPTTYGRRFDTIIQLLKSKKQG